MRARSARLCLLQFVVVLLLCWLALFVAGCTGPRVRPAEIPSNQLTPVVWNQATADVIGQGFAADAQVIASALESNPENGSVIYIDHHGFVHGPDGQVVFDQNGNPLRLRTKIIAKLNSLQNFGNLEGVSEVDYEVGGRSYLPDLPDHLKHLDTCPVPLRLRIKGLNQAGVASSTAANREAAAREREAIFAGLSQLATARGAAFATRVEALGNASVKVITATGREILGRVLGTLPLEAGIAAAGAVVEARIQAANGDVSRVVAAGEQAAVLTAAAQPAGQ